MAASAEESQPLLAAAIGTVTDSKERKSPSLIENRCCSKFKSCFLIEPVLMLYFFSEFPLVLAGQKYIIEWITDASLKRDALLNISHGSINQTLSPCDVNISYLDYSFQESIQKTSSLFLIIRTLVWTVPAFFVTISLGASSDKLGRRIAVIPPLVGILCGSTILAVVAWLKASIVWLLLGDLIYGCSGAFTSIVTGSIAFVVDQTTPGNRMYRITIIHLCILISATVSPIVVGPLLARIGCARTVFIVFILSAANLLYSFIFLPNNTRKKSNKIEKNQTEATINVNTNIKTDQPTVDQCLPSGCLHQLVTQLKISLYLFIKQPVAETPSCSCCTTSDRSCLCSCLSKRRFKLKILLASFFMTTVPSFDISVTTLFEMNSPLCWSVGTIGVYTGMSLGVATIGAMVATPIMKRCLADHTIAILGGVTSTATRVYMSFVNNSLMMFLTPSLMMFNVLLVPSIRSMMSLLVSEKEQGAVFGMIAAVEVICCLLGAIIFNLVYSATLLIATSFVFLISGLFFAIGTILLVFYKIIIRRESTLHLIIENTVA